MYIYVTPIVVMIHGKYLYVIIYCVLGFGAGGDIWSHFTDSCALSNCDHGAVDVLEAASTLLHSEAIAGAVAQTAIIPPGGKVTMTFSLAWDVPIVRFGSGTPFYRRYTRYSLSILTILNISISKSSE